MSFTAVYGAVYFYNPHTFGIISQQNCIYLTENGVNPDTLQEAAVLALSQADCEDAYSQTPYDVFEDMVCVGHDNDVYVGGCYVRIFPCLRNVCEDLKEK